MTIISLGLAFVPPVFWSGMATRCYFRNPCKSQNNPRNRSQENTIRDLFRLLLEKHGIRSDVQFRIDPKKIAYSVGGNATKYAAIFVHPEFREIDEDAFRFAVKHEVGHIKHNDRIAQLLLSLAVSIVVAIFFPYAVGTSILAGIAASLTSMLVTVIISGKVSRHQEKKADDFAIANACNAELFGAIRLFKAFQFLEQEGEIEEAILHPSNLSRIKKCEQELRKRGQSLVENPFDFLKVINIKRLGLGRPTVTEDNFFEQVNSI